MTYALHLVVDALQRSSIPEGPCTDDHKERMTKESGARRGRGRPPVENGLKIKRGDDGSILRLQVAESANYAALAFQVTERIDRARVNKEKLSIVAAVRAEVLHAIRRNNETPPDPDRRPPQSWEIVREGRAEEWIKTAYIEVRKLLAKQRRNESKAGHADALGEANKVHGSLDALMEAHRRWNK